MVPRSAGVESKMKRLIKSILGAFGKEIRNIDAPTRVFRRGMEVLGQVVSPATVIDVGVATGTPELYSVFSAQRYLLVEANPGFRGDLERLETELDAVVETVFCGGSRGETELNVYTDPFKSSAFEVHRDLERTARIRVPVETLDGLVARHRLPPSYLIKVDVEGSERDVLRGALDTLSKADAVILEASVLPRFRGGPEFADLIGDMSSQGFCVFDIIAGVNHPKSGHLYQVDVVFVRKEAAFRIPEGARDGESGTGGPRPRTDSDSNGRVRDR